MFVFLFIFSLVIISSLLFQFYIIYHETNRLAVANSKNKEDVKTYMNFLCSSTLSDYILNIKDLEYKDWFFKIWICFCIFSSSFFRKSTSFFKFMSLWYKMFIIVFRHVLSLKVSSKKWDYMRLIWYYLFPPRIQWN